MHPDPKTTANAANTNPAPARTPGRPAVLGKTQRDRVIALLTHGCSRRIAARFVGCSPSTITQTAQRDPEFAEQLARAEASLEIQMLKAIRNAADRHWRAAGWLLERKNPTDYAPVPPNLFTPEQVLQLFAAALDSIHNDLPAPQRDQATQKLTTLLLEFDNTTPNQQ